MEILYEFRGVVFLLANMDNPQNIILQRYTLTLNSFFDCVWLLVAIYCRDFSSRLFAFLRLTMPTADLRGKLWRALLPPAAPLAGDLDFTSLGKRFELYPGDIQAAVAFAAAEVANRQADKAASK